MTLLHDQPTTSLPPDTATPAPTGPWRVLVEWARGQDCLGDLLLIAYSMHCERNPEWMGSVLWPLGQPANLDLLVRWAAELPELQPLHAVGQCVAYLDAGVQDVIPAPLPPEVPPEQQLRGYLKFNYLLAACIDRPPQPKDKSRSDAVALWFTKVRLWLLGQALIRAQRSNRLDTNIKIVADALRLASSRKPDWLALVSALLAPLPTDFDSISQSLRRRSQECLNKQDCLLGAAQREALHAIARIARNEDAPFGLDDERKMELPPIFRKVRPEPVRPDNLSLPLSDDSDVGLLIEVGDVSTGAEEERRAVYTGDEFATQQERKAVGRTILLHASEAAQFLPWSWHQLTDDETASITGWLRREECRGDADALLAAMVWTALSTGYSLLQTVRFPLADELGRDWSISRDCETLQRIVPRPAYKTALSMEQLAVLEPLAGTHVVTLPIWVQRTFKQAAPASGGTACELIDLWKSADETPEQAYRRVATQHGFGRVTPGMLGKHLAYTLYRESGDGLFAWMASVHGRTALPGASAYPSWRGSELTSRFGVAGIGITVPDGQERNALGSRLRPVEFELSAVLQRGLDRLGCMASAGSIAERHNAYTCSLVLHLLVATGARPIVDPFESPLYFDLNLHRVFVSDKLVSTEEGGRLVPLPEAVAKLIGRYCDYLRDLSATLQGSRPHLGHSIRCLVERTAPFSMPFFFFMNGSASDWESISEDGIKRLMATEMALPLNVFRHRLSSRLRECGVDPELIDGLLGHAYSDCESYGDLSLRCWEKDMESVIPHLNELYAQLGLREPYPPECPTQEGIGQLSSCVTTAGTQRLFGIARRLHDQRLRRAEARKQARQMVEDWIGNRKLEDIQQSDLEPILRALTTTPNGMPHRLANIRYDVLRRFIEQSKRGGRSKLRLSRVDMSLNEDRPMAQASAVIASPTISILLNALPDLRKQYPPGSGKVADAQFMASLHLLVESRIADPRIHSVVGNKKALRLVLYGQRYWIEYVGTEGYDDEEEAGWGIGPVLRYPISVDAATYLRDGWCDGRGTTVIHKAVWRILKATGYPSVGEANGDRTLSLLRELVDQHNRLGMPGVLAGVLAGRISACSLDHHDWIRLETGEILAPSHPEELLNAGFIELDGASGGNVTKEPDARSVLQNDARSYFRELRLILDQGTITDKKSKARRELCRSIKKTLEGYRGKVSSALLILGEWLEHLARTVNRVRSVMRYLNSLSGAAAEVWYDEDLLLADEDEVTAVYARLLEARPDRDLRTVGLHLRRFHAFARSEFALPEPDWAELPLPPESVSIRPAYLREADYHAALTALQSQELPQDYVTAGSMLLLLAYRYGLRVAEALGLSRGDWLGEAEPLIRVQNNALRKLKTPAGRRLVPTLFTLSDLEKSIIERVLLSAEAMHGDRTSAPLLAG